MTTNRIVPVLVSLAIIIQAVVFYRQYVRPAETARFAPVFAAPQNTFVNIDGWLLRGNPKARVLLIEFSDYECPYCIRHAMSVGKQLQSDFVAPGKIQYTFANNPLRIHSDARLLALAALCAGRQDHYWEMHDAIFELRPRNKNAVFAVGAGLGSLDGMKFQECIESGAGLKTQIERDTETAKALGLTGTPGFALAVLEDNGRATVKTVIQGAQGLSLFHNVIEELLRKQP